MKQQKNSKLRWAIKGLVITALLAAGWFGGNFLLDYSNEKKAKQLSEQVVASLLREGKYASIKQFVDNNFLGDITEEEYDKSASDLTNLKDSKVVALNYSKTDKTVSVFGTIAPSDVDTQGDYLFGYYVTLEKTGINSYKVTSIETDYGNQSYSDANRE